MKKIFATLITCIFMLAGCGNPKIIDGVLYDTYGYLNQDTNKNEKIAYKVITGNVIWSIILCETIIAPAYFIGFDLYEPVGLEKDYIKGQLR